jgi:subtilase-type serine protease
MHLVPALQLDYTRLQSPSYVESGAGDLNLSVQGKRSEDLLLGTGARLNYALSTTSQISTYLGASYDPMRVHLASPSPRPGPPTRHGC